jgi:hypothetical protein
VSAGFTPGPWRVCGHERGVCSCVQIWSIPTDCPVATAEIGEWGDEYPAIRHIEGNGMSGTTVEAYMHRITYGEVPESAAKANARLIAAAPELYEALQEAVVYSEAEFPWTVRARAALAKARGEA